MFPNGPNVLNSYKALLSFQARHPSPYENLFNQYGDVVGLNLTGLGKVILSQDKGFNEYILLKNYKNYVKSDHYNEIKPLLGNGLVTSEGDFWKQQRKKVTPSFSTWKSHHISKRFNQILERHLQEIKNTNKVDITSFYMNLVFELVGDFLFGENILEYAENVQRELNTFLEKSVSRMFQLFKTPNHIRIGTNKSRLKSSDEIVRIVNILIDKAQPGSLAWLFKEKKAFSSNDELVDELLTLLLAGYETTSLALTWSTVLLAKNINEQRLIRSSLNDGNDLLLSHWHESLRLYPSVPQVSRHTLKDDQYNGLQWSQDTLIMILVYHSHRNQSYYEKPNEYDLMRFQSNSKSHGAYLPFSLGPRKCLGAEMSTQQGLYILNTLLQRYEISFTDLNPCLDVDMQVSLKPSERVYLKLTST